MTVWRRGSLGRNPYRRTAFCIARAPREITRHGSLVQLVTQTRNVIKADSQAHTISEPAIPPRSQAEDVPVSLEELNAAERILLEPRDRILEELLHHATEHVPLEDVRKLLKRCAEAMAPGEDEAPCATDTGTLKVLTDHVFERFLEATGRCEGSFGALELTLVPPLGAIGED